MWRRRVARIAAIGLSVPLIGVASTAMASQAPGPAGSFSLERAKFFAERLRADPVYLTDNAPDQLPPGTSGQVKMIVSRLGVPVYVVVTLTGLTRTDADTSDTLVPLIHDVLGKDGVYIVTDPAGGGTAVQYGGSLPVTDAWQATREELPVEGGGLLRYLQHFVDLVTSGQAEAHYRNPHWPPRPRPETDPWEEKARKEDLATDIGAVIGGVTVIGLLLYRRLRKEAGQR